MPLDTAEPSTRRDASALTLPEVHLMQWLSVPGRGCTRLGRLVVNGVPVSRRFWTETWLPSGVARLCRTLMDRRLLGPSGDVGTGPPCVILTPSAEGRLALEVAHRTFLEPSALAATREDTLRAAYQGLLGAKAHRRSAEHALFARILGAAGDTRLDTLGEWRDVTDAGRALAAAQDRHTRALALPRDR